MMSPIIFHLIGVILIFYICLYLIKNSKIYDGALNILIEMGKKLEKKPKKPKNPDLQWEIYHKEHKEIKENIKSLELEFKDIKKHNYWIPIGIAIFTLAFFIISVVIQYYDSSGGFIEKPEIIGYEIINKHANTTEEMYRIWLHNTGDITAEDITIKIEFPFENSKIIQLFKHAKEIIVEDSEYGGVGSYKYGLKYSEILVGEHINLTINIDINDLGKNETDILYPDAKVWIGNNPPIDLIRRYDINFYR